ncbi:YHYH protein [Acaryochloris sp. IP29b_bin.148]|uniref:YHYH protein n=1 Tax=Acaryochloris sp. IP29b_bin.148 TaxID=2969218 RepID=UPI002611F558|nr:YHYH protein [Acaryochloris sp. IP29b_bin.148]
MTACSSTEESATTNEVPSPQPEEPSAKASISLNPSYFVKENLAKEITQESCTLSDGTKSSCYVITIKPDPQEHQMGPWCPTNEKDGKEKGGIWFRSGEVYDVDGAFIAGLADFYSDSAWKLVNDDGSIRVTNTQEAFEAAAKPDVDPRYNNYCVEGRPEWVTINAKTYVIPVTPVYQTTPTDLGRDGIGVAFNGVNFDPPAPLNAILAAHTIAPLDDNGGHINPHTGYHYHAATGQTKEIAQTDNHAPMIGYALDGFAIYAQLDKDQQEPTGLDDSRGHSDSTRGYHYHAGAPGSNQIIQSFRGLTASLGTETSNDSKAPGPDNRPPRRGPDFAAAAQKLGVSESQLREALGSPENSPPQPGQRPPKPDLAAAAQKLGVTEQQLAEALGRPPNPPGR